MAEPSMSPDDRPRVQLAFRWAAERFRDNRAALMGLAAPVAGILLLQGFVSSPLQNVPEECLDPAYLLESQACLTSVSEVLFAALATELMFVMVAAFAAIGSCRAALRTSRGERAQLADLLAPENAVGFLVYILAFGALTLVGTVLCIVPGLIAIFLLQLGPFFVLDRGYGPGEAMRASARTAMRNPGPVALMTLVNSAALLLGEMCLGILMLLMLPLSTLLTAYMYRRFNHETVR